MVRGSIYKKKVLQDPGPNTHSAVTIHKVVLTPTPPPSPPPKKGYPGTGGYMGKYFLRCENIFLDALKNNITSKKIQNI